MMDKLIARITYSRLYIHQDFAVLIAMLQQGLESLVNHLV
jgi:hypothetical protein